MKLRKILFWSVAIAVSVFFLFLALKKIDWPGFFALIKTADILFILPGFLIMFFSFTMRSYRWKFLIDHEQADYKKVFWATGTGYFGNNFLPARAGELARCLLLGKNTGISKAYLIATALTERITDVPIVLFLGMALSLTLETLPAQARQVAMAGAIISLVSVIMIFAAPLWRRIAEKILSKLPLPERLNIRLSHLIEHFEQGVGRLRNLKTLAGYLGISVVIWLADAFFMVMFAKAYHFDMSFGLGMVLITALALSSVLPSTPGQVGVYQYVAILVLTPFGASNEAALAVILTFQVVFFGLSLVTGLPGFLALSGSKAVAEPRPQT